MTFTEALTHVRGFATDSPASLGVRSGKTNVSGDFARALGIVLEELYRLRTIVNAAWEVRREERDYNPCPDLALRATARKRLHELIDEWKAQSAKGARNAETTNPT